MMNKSISIELIDGTNLTEQKKIRLDKITEIENYFQEEIDQRKSCSKKLSKYVATFNCIDFNCFKCNNWRSIYMFLYERC